MEQSEQGSLGLYYYPHFTDETSKAQRDQADLTRVAQLVSNEKEEGPRKCSFPP